MTLCKKSALLALLATGCMTGLFAQQKGSGDNPPGSLTLNIDSAAVTHHEVTIRGQRVPYTATAGAMPVWDDDGKPVAGVFYTYYERSDVKDQASRPLVISFNGGPGTPSV